MFSSSPMPIQSVGYQQNANALSFGSFGSAAYLPANAAGVFHPGAGAGGIPAFVAVRPTTQFATPSTAMYGTGTLIPNRIFVGGIPPEAGESELKTFFSQYGLVKDVKIIVDRAGVSKGYGFVTFDSQEVAEKLLKTEPEMYFRDRKLHIGPAVRRHVGAWQLSTAVGGQTVATLQGAFGIAGIAGQPGQIVTLAPTYGPAGDYQTAALLGGQQSQLGLAAQTGNAAALQQPGASFLVVNNAGMQQAASLFGAAVQNGVQSNQQSMQNASAAVANGGQAMSYRALSTASSPSGSGMQLRVAPNSH